MRALKASGFMSNKYALGGWHDLSAQQTSADTAVLGSIGMALLSLPRPHHSDTRASLPKHSDGQEQWRLLFCRGGVLSLVLLMGGS